MDILREDGDDGLCMMRGCCESDFLPTRCHTCNRRFCSKHLRPEAHLCAAHARRDAKAVDCPMCMQPIAVRPGESADFAISRHIDTGCAPQSAQQAADRQQLNFCSVHSCGRNEIQRIICDHCGQTYCVEHRHPKAHSCRAAPRSPPPSAVQTSPAASEEAGGQPRKPKRQRYVRLAELAPRNTVATAAQMPPSKAAGVPDGQFAVLVVPFVPLRPGGKPQSMPPLWLSVPPTVSVGRVLDAVCSILDVPNENHVLREDAEKLWIHLLPVAASSASAKSSPAPSLNLSATGDKLGGDAHAVCLPPSFIVRECMESFPFPSSAGGRGPVLLLCKGNEVPADVVTDLATNVFGSGHTARSTEIKMSAGNTEHQRRQPSGEKSARRENSCVAA